MIYNETVKIKKLTLNVTFEKTGDGRILATVPSLPGCQVYGKNIPQAREMIIPVIEKHILSLEKAAIYKKKENWFVGWIDAVPGANTQGTTLAEARTNMREALLLVLGANASLVSNPHIFRRELLEINVPA